MDDGYDDSYSIPEGNYSATLLEYRTGEYFKGTPKVEITFSIYDLGEYNGKTIKGYYTVQRLTGKPRKWGKFKGKPRGNLTRDLAWLMNTRPPLDCIPKELFGSVVCEISTRMVEEVGGVHLAPSQQYLRQDRILRRVVL